MAHRGPQPLLQLRHSLVGVTVHSKDRLSVRRSLIPLALAVCITAAAASCRDPSPVGVYAQAPAFQQPGRSALRVTQRAGVDARSQTAESVTGVSGPAAGRIA